MGHPATTTTGDHHHTPATGPRTTPVATRNPEFSAGLAVESVKRPGPRVLASGRAVRIFAGRAERTSPRLRLRHEVERAAGGARSPEEFFAGLRDAGVLVRERFSQLRETGVFAPDMLLGETTATATATVFSFAATYLRKRRTWGRTLDKQSRVQRTAGPVRGHHGQQAHRHHTERRRLRP